MDGLSYSLPLKDKYLEILYSYKSDVEALSLIQINQQTRIFSKEWRGGSRIIKD